MDEFDPQYLQAGKTYLCRDGSIATLVANENDDWLTAVENGFDYASDEPYGNLIYGEQPSEDIHDKDIVDFAPKQGAEE